MLTLEEQIINCTSCPIHRLQTPPVPYVGSLDAPVLVMAQNPGIIRTEDFPGHQIAADMRKAAERGDIEAYMGLYAHDFRRSYANRVAFAALLGEGWLDSGVFVFTNAIHCRTELNRPPTPMELIRCTNHSVGIKQAWKQTGRAEIVIVMGNLASTRFFQVPFPPFGAVTKQGDISLLRIPHYSSRTGRLDKMQTYSKTLRKLLKEHQIRWSIT